MRTKHKIQAEIEVFFSISGMPPDEHEVAYPEVEIEYSYLPGSPACYYQRNGDPGWPAEAAEVELISAKLIEDDGLAPTQERIDDWAQGWLDDKGYDTAIEHAMDERDRREEP